MTSLRRFLMNRTTDITGTSGTGTVAEGVQFSDGTVIIRWRPVPATSTCVYASVDELLQIHGHDGATTIEWLDADPDNLCSNSLHELPYTPPGEYAEYDGCEECDYLAHRHGLTHSEVAKAADWVHCGVEATLGEAIDRAIEEA